MNCPTGKIRHDTSAAAHAALANMLARPGRGPKSLRPGEAGVYQCETCRSWHTTNAVSEARARPKPSKASSFAEILERRLRAKWLGGLDGARFTTQSRESQFLLLSLKVEFARLDQAAAETSAERIILRQIIAELKARIADLGESGELEAA